MDRRALAAALREVPEVWIEGVREPQPPPPEFLFLRRAGDSWETGVCERGRWNVVASFPDEAAACAHLLDLAHP